MSNLYDENGYIPDIVDNDGKVIPAEIFFSKENIKSLNDLITEELDKELLEKLREIKNG